MSTTTNATNPAAAVADALTNDPHGTTVRALASATGVSPSATAKILSAMENAGTAVRRPGTSNGKGKPADMWRPITDASPADVPADVVSDTPSDVVPADVVSADVTADVVLDTPAEVVPADAVPADVVSDTPADVVPVDAVAVDVVPDAPVSGIPALAGPRQPDLKVLIMVGVFGGHPDGISAADAVEKSGLAPVVGDTVLAAMEVAGAARRLPVDADGVELWVRGDGDLSTVDLANAPTHVTCPTCGHARKVRRPLATGRRTGGGGRAVGEMNGDGSQRLAKNGLRSQVEGFMRDLGPGHDVTPGTVARELGGRSSGAVANAMSRLTEDGVLIMTSEAPVKYALADDAPAPSADVAAYMTRDADADGDGDVVETAQAA